MGRIPPHHDTHTHTPVTLHCGVVCALWCARVWEKKNLAQDSKQRVHHLSRRSTSDLKKKHKNYFGRSIDSPEERSLSPEKKQTSVCAVGEKNLRS